MKPYQHILIATNLSSKSIILTNKAADLAKQYKAKLSLVHVLGLSPTLYGNVELAIPLNNNIENSVKQQAQEQLQQEALRLNIPHSQCHLDLGPTVESLVDLAKSESIDLLVVGSHPQHGLDSLFGSVANSLLHQMPCDILAISIH